MLGKLFKRKSVPENDGEKQETELPAGEVKKFNYVKVFGLELSNMEETPVYTLKSQLSVGSEIGDIIISDPSVSPRHATFILQQDVSSVIDHGSVAGTYINGKKIPVGKYIILEESDVISVGDLEVRLRVSTEAQPMTENLDDLDSEEMAEDEILEEVVELEDEEVPELPDLPEVPEEEIEEDIEEDAEEDVEKEDNGDEEDSSEIDEQEETPSRLAKSELRSANSLVRLVAVVSDVLFSYSILVILSPFDEFRSFLESIQELLRGLFPVDWDILVSTLKEENGFLGTLFVDAYNFLSSTFNVGPLLFMFILVRFISTLIFGVSVSELLLSMRSRGNVIWARIGGALRVLVGAITGPFLVFDAPAIISRRTFKEVLTFTHLYTSSRMMAILGSFIIVPLMIMLALFSPLFEGLEPPSPVGINDRVDQRVKVKAADNEETSEEYDQVIASDQSSVLGLKLNYNSSELSLIPGFRFQGVKSKMTVRPGLVFYQRDTQRQLELEVFKTFDLRQLLGMAMKGNIPLHTKYPQLYNFVYESPESNPAFKKQNDLSSNMAFSNEFIEFTKVAFSLSLENAVDLMQSETFLIKGLIDYKASFLGLIEYKDFDDIKFIKVGNAFVMRISYQKQKPFELLIPLIKGEGKIYKLSLGRRENAESIINKFFKYNLEKADWFSEESRSIGETMSALEVFDFFFSADLKKELNNETKAQRLYAYYFETSAAFLKKKDPVELDIWKVKTKALLKLIEEISPDLPEGDDSGNVVNKLEQNFTDLMDALENNNLEYFGIEETSII